MSDPGLFDEIDQEATEKTHWEDFPDWQKRPDQGVKPVEAPKYHPDPRPWYMPEKIVKDDD